MAANINDKITSASSGVRPVNTTVSNIRNSGNTTLSCADLTGWPTASAVHFVTYKLDGTGNLVVGSQSDWKGVVSGVTITDLVLTGGSDNGNAIGDIVVCLPTARYGKELYDALSTEHKLTGAHKDITADSLATDTILESTPANGVTIDGLNLKDGKLNTNNSVPVIAMYDGAEVQRVYANYSAVATGTTTIPLDDTIPQNTEGTEFMSLAITPKSATNILTIEVVAFLSVATASRWHVGALFQDSTANALAADANFQATSTAATTFTLTHSMVAGTTSATTFKFRAGPETAGTMSFNGFSGNRLFGAVTKSSITITETKAS